MNKKNKKNITIFTNNNCTFNNFNNQYTIYTAISIFLSLA